MDLIYSDERRKEMGTMVDSGSSERKSALLDAIHELESEIDSLSVKGIPAIRSAFKSVLMPELPKEKAVIELKCAADCEAVERIQKMTEGVRAISNAINDIQSRSRA